MFFRFPIFQRNSFRFFGHENDENVFGFRLISKSVFVVFGFRTLFQFWVFVFVFARKENVFAKTFSRFRFSLPTSG